MANSNGIIDPFVVKYDNAQGISTGGDDARFGLGGLTMGLPSSSFGYATGVYPASYDSSGITDLRVGPQSSPNMTVLIQPGNYVAGRTSHGAYFGGFTAAQTLVIPTANGSNPRYDVIVIRNRDGGITGDGTVTQSAFPFVIQGTPAASPVAPSGSVTDGDVVLAYVYVGAAVTSITSANVIDRRLYATAAGGIYPKPSYDARMGGYEGQYRDNSDTNALERFDGAGNWIAIASPSTWNQFSPVLFATTSATNVNLGTGGQYVGRWQVTGKRLDLNYYWHWGTSGYNGGWGPIISYLPSGLVSAPYNQWINSHLWVHNTALTADFAGEALVGASSNIVRPWFPINLTDNRGAGYQVAATNAAVGTGIPLVPGGFPEGGDLTISGSIEIA